jgi:guanylate kinase
LFARSTEAEDIIKQRMEITKEEILKIQACQFIDLQIINDDKVKACLNLKEKLIEAYPQLKE